MVTVVQRADGPIPYAHRSKTAEKDTAIDAIPVANDISRRLLPPVCLRELTSNPFRVGMCRYTRPQKLTAAMPTTWARLPIKPAGDSAMLWALLICENRGDCNL